MRIVDAKWYGNVNRVVVRCQCGREFEHRSDGVNIMLSLLGEVSMGYSPRMWG